MCQTSASSTSTTGGSTRVAWDLSVVGGDQDSDLSKIWSIDFLGIFWSTSGFFLVPGSESMGLALNTPTFINSVAKTKTAQHHPAWISRILNYFDDFWCIPGWALDDSDRWLGDTVGHGGSPRSQIALSPQRQHSCTKGRSSVSNSSWSLGTNELNGLYLGHFLLRKEKGVPKCLLRWREVGLSLKWDFHPQAANNSLGNLRHTSLVILNFSIL